MEKKWEPEIVKKPVEKPKPKEKPVFLCNLGHVCSDLRGLQPCFDCCNPSTTFGCAQCQIFFCKSCKALHMKGEKFFPRLMTPTEFTQKEVQILVCPRDHHLKEGPDSSKYCDNCAKVKPTKWKCG